MDNSPAATSSTNVCVYVTMFLKLVGLYVNRNQQQGFQNQIANPQYFVDFFFLFFLEGGGGLFQFEVDSRKVLSFLITMLIANRKKQQGLRNQIANPHFLWICFGLKVILEDYFFKSYYFKTNHQLPWAISSSSFTFLRLISCSGSFYIKPFIDFVFIL